MQEAYRLPCCHSNFLLFWRGGPLTKKNFPVWTCIKPNLVSKKCFPLLGGVPWQKIFFRSEHVSSQIQCQKFFPLLGEGGPSTKIFSGLNMYQAKYGVKNFSLYWGGAPQQKNFFPVWTCIRPNLVSKNFPFTWEEGVPRQNFFSGLNMYQAKSGVKNFSLSLGGVPWQKIIFWFEPVSSQIWCQKFFPLLGGGPLTKKFFPSLNMYQAKSGVKKFSLYWDRVPPPEQTHTCENITSHLTYVCGQ